MIVGVAIRYDGKEYRLPKPNRHHNVIRMIAKENGVGINGPDIQGFYTDKGVFLDRYEGMKYATAEGQVLPRGIHEYNGNELFSEDLW